LEAEEIMKYRIARSEDSDWMRAVHKMAFGGDPWPGDDHEFWVVYDEHNGVAAFCSAIETRAGTGFLSRAAVTLNHRGKGLQQRMIKTREAWLRAQGVKLIVTHVEKFNYASLVALLNSGYRLAERRVCPRGYTDFHFLYKGDPTHLRQALEDTVTED
jgi:GNAT superfamily N-acetyltransferase